MPQSFSLWFSSSGILHQSLYAKQNKIIRRLSLTSLNLQENFFELKYAVKWYFYWSVYFIHVSPLEARYEKSFLDSLGNEVNKSELQLRFPQIWKVLLYLEPGKKKKNLDFKAVSRKM